MKAAGRATKKASAKQSKEKAATQTVDSDEDDSLNSAIGLVKLSRNNGDEDCDEDEDGDTVSETSETTKAAVKPPRCRLSKHKKGDGTFPDCYLSPPHPN